MVPHRETDQPAANREPEGSSKTRPLNQKAKGEANWSTPTIAAAKRASFGRQPLRRVTAATLLAIRSKPVALAYTPPTSPHLGSPPSQPRVAAATAAPQPPQCDVWSSCRSGIRTTTSRQACAGLERAVRRSAAAPPRAPSANAAPPRARAPLRCRRETVENVSAGGRAARARPSAEPRPRRSYGEETKEYADEESSLLSSPPVEENVARAHKFLTHPRVWRPARCDRPRNSPKYVDGMRRTAPDPRGGGAAPRLSTATFFISVRSARRISAEDPSRAPRRIHVCGRGGAATPPSEDPASVLRATVAFRRSRRRPKRRRSRSFRARTAAPRRSARRSRARAATRPPTTAAGRSGPRAKKQKTSARRRRAPPSRGGA